MDNFGGMFFPKVLLYGGKSIIERSPMVRPLPFSVNPQNDDEKFMLEALKEAWKAYQADEVPVGAVLVSEGRVIARGYNQVEMLKDATAHAEMLCITAGETAMGNWRLTNTSLYCTIEQQSSITPLLMLTLCVGWGCAKRFTQLPLAP